MKTFAKLALTAPVLLALSACGGAEEAETTDMDAAAVPVDEPEIPLERFEDAREDQTTATDPLADPAAPNTPEVNEGDAAIDEEITSDPAITEGM